MDSWDPARHPRFADADVAEVILEPGDVLFIPKKWGHYTRALDTSISQGARCGGRDVPAQRHGGPRSAPAAGRRGTAWMVLAASGWRCVRFPSPPHRATRRSQALRNSSNARASALGSTACVCPSSVRWRALGMARARVWIASRIQPGLAPPSMTSVAARTAGTRSKTPGAAGRDEKVVAQRVSELLEAGPHRRLAQLRDGWRGHLHHLREVQLDGLRAPIPSGGLVELFREVFKRPGPARIEDDWRLIDDQLRDRASSCRGIDGQEATRRVAEHGG